MFMHIAAFTMTACHARDKSVRCRYFCHLDIQDRMHRIPHVCILRHGHLRFTATSVGEPKSSRPMTFSIVTYNIGFSTHSV